MSTDVDLAVLEAEVAIVKADVKQLKELIDRLPNWAVAGFTVAGLVIGFLANNCWK